MHQSRLTAFWVLALVLVPTQASAGASDQTPCRGRWQGIGNDPWDPEPYRIELLITGGAGQCATVTYPGLCTTRWINCVVNGDTLEADEVLVDPGICVPAHVSVRCSDPDTLEAKWVAEPGVMETTLTRVREPEPEPATPKRHAVEPVVETREPKPAGATDDRGCGFASGWIVLPLLAVRRRRVSGYPGARARTARARGADCRHS